MSDRFDIQDCLARYARGVDRIDEDLIRSAFWPDAIDEHGRVSGGPEEFLAWLLPNQRTRQVAQHLLMNSTVELRGDTASVETYFISVAKQWTDDAIELVGGRYLDQFARRGDQWRVLRRRVLLDWQSKTDASSMAARLSGSYRGTRDGTDSSFNLFEKPAT